MEATVQELCSIVDPGQLVVEVRWNVLETKLGEELVSHGFRGAGVEQRSEKNVHALDIRADHIPRRTRFKLVPCETRQTSYKGILGHGCRKLAVCVQGSEGIVFDLLVDMRRRRSTGDQREVQ